MPRGILLLEIDFDAVTGPVDPSFRTKAMQEAAEAYAKRFDQAVVFEGDDGGEEETEEEEGRTAGGASTSGAHRPELLPVAGRAQGAQVS